MSYLEAQRWASYMKEHGPVNSTRRIEQMLAKLCWVVQKVNGGKLEVEDFLPEYGEPEEDAPDIQQFLAILTSARVK